MRYGKSLTRMIKHVQKKTIYEHFIIERPILFYKSLGLLFTIDDFFTRNASMRSGSLNEAEAGTNPLCVLNSGEFVQRCQLRRHFRDCTVVKLALMPNHHRFN